jgi:hypothetical protein
VYEVNVGNGFVFIGRSGLKNIMRMSKKPQYIDTLRGKKERLKVIKATRRKMMLKIHGTMVGSLINAGMDMTGEGLCM